MNCGGKKSCGLFLSNIVVSLVVVVVVSNVNLGVYSGLLSLSQTPRKVLNSPNKWYNVPIQHVPVRTVSAVQGGLSELPRRHVAGQREG